MKIRYIALFSFSIALLNSCFTNDKTKTNSIHSKKDSLLVNEEYNRYFNACNVDGSIVIYDHLMDKWIVSDSAKIKTQSLPASTFKIINLLIALETKSIADENEIVSWPGDIDTIKYGYRPHIYRDMTIKEAFEVSAGWVFVELAKRIGKKNYRKYLTLCDYGNLDLTQKDDDFWNFGAYKISPLNQVEFIKKLYEENLPFSKRNFEIVKKVMITEQNENYIIRSKTGWTRDNDTNTGWWVGYVESEHGAYSFATNLSQDRRLNTANFGDCRKNISLSIFKDLNIIN